MGFWFFMLAMDILTPVTMICFGKIFLNNAPREINMGFGYRTKMSMKNKDTWQFAHKYCGKIWYTLGMILLPLSIIAMLFVIGKDTDTVGNWGGTVCLMQIIPLVGSILPTEIALKKTFDENGQRR